MKSLKSLLCTVASAGFLVSYAASASAASFTWNKSSVPAAPDNQHWMNSANWNSATGGVPGAGDTANINIALSNSITVNLLNDPSIPKVGVLNVGDAGPSNFTINFGGGTTRYMIMDSGGAGDARINKTSGNLVVMTRGLSFASNTVLNAEAGRFVWDGVNARMYGQGVLTIEGAGTVAFNSSATSTVFAADFNANLSVRSAGTLLVNNTFTASTITPAASVAVQSTGRLGGAGTIGRATTIESGGRLTPGAEIGNVGVLSFSKGLTLNEGSNFDFQLQSNTVTGRGTAYDGVNVSGGDFTIAGGALFNVTFNGSGSTVDFSSAFWDADQEWLVFQGDTAATGLFTLGTVSGDALGASFDATGGALGFKQVGNDVYLSYSTIPEPGSVTMLFGAASVAAIMLRRKAGRSEAE